MKRFAAIVLVLSLSNCTAINALNSGKIKNVTPAMVYKLQESYDIARAGMVVYRSLPWCSDVQPQPCQSKAIARQIKNADAAAMLALADLKRFSEAHDVINISAAYDAAVTAVAASERIAQIYQVSQ